MAKNKVIGRRRRTSAGPFPLIRLRRTDTNPALERQRVHVEAEERQDVFGGRGCVLRLPDRLAKQLQDKY